MIENYKLLAYNTCDYRVEVQNFHALFVINETFSHTHIVIRYIFNHFHPEMMNRRFSLYYVYNLCIYKCNIFIRYTIHLVLASLNSFHALHVLYSIRILDFLQNYKMFFDDICYMYNSSVWHNNVNPLTAWLKSTIFVSLVLVSRVFLERFRRVLAHSPLSI